MDRCEMKDLDAIRRFVQAGRSCFSIQSKVTGAWMTYEVTQGAVSALTGSDNTKSYTFMGTLEGGKFTFQGFPWLLTQDIPQALHNRVTTLLRQVERGATPNAWEVKALQTWAKSLNLQVSSMSPTDLKVRSFQWFWLQQVLPEAKMAFYHEGRCGRCNRRLTVPASILSGLGPECAQREGVALGA